MHDPVMTERQVATKWKISLKTLRKWRTTVWVRLAAFADFGPVSGSGVEARNGQERVECGPERQIRAAAEVRKCSQEPARVRGNQRDRARKNPNREQLGLQ